MEGRELRRCYTQVDFTAMRPLRTSHQQVRVRAQPAGKMSPKVRHKFPTMEIYRPPVQRGGVGDAMPEVSPPNTRLNVHAKEFVMCPNPISTSKSTGSMVADGVMAASSSPLGPGILLSSVKQTPSKHVQVRWEEGVAKGGRGLQRSKSMTASKGGGGVCGGGGVGGGVGPSPASLPSDTIITPMGPLSQHHSDNIKQAVNGVGSLTSEEIMDIVKILIDRAMEGRNYATIIATISDKIIDKDPSTMFFESLINYCQFTLNKLKENTVNRKYNGLMGFLCELYITMKPKQLSKDPRWGLLNPVQWLLRLLIKCGQEVLHDPHLHLKPDQVESLFVTVTTVGRDMELELPQATDSLMAGIRDAFLVNERLSQPLKKTLLQIIEIHAAGWQLPAFTLTYYNTNSHSLC